MRGAKTTKGFVSGFFVEMKVQKSAIGAIDQSDCRKSSDEINFVFKVKRSSQMCLLKAARTKKQATFSYVLEILEKLFGTKFLHNHASIYMFYFSKLKKSQKNILSVNNFFDLVFMGLLGVDC
ncbi:MAG: hypothetical protein AAFV95_17505 [Bacteroidota bacterium]